MTPQIPLDDILEDLAQLVRLIDRFPVSQKTHVPWLALRANAWSITPRLDWLRRNWHTPRACPSCGKPRVSRPPGPSADALQPILEVPKSGKRDSPSRIRPRRSRLAFQKLGNPTAH